MLRAFAATLCLMSGCTGAPHSHAIAPSDPAIRYGGYVDLRSPDAPRLAWPGTHIAARFTGTSLRAKLTSTPVEDETRETDWITVVIDDGEPKTFALAEGEHVYPLAEGLRAGSHRVLIWKRTEAEVGTITFHGFVLDGGARLGPPLPAPARRLLFIGDSITAGYGIEGPDATCGWSAARENNYLTYGAVAARALEAEYVAAAWSGKGISRNFDARDEHTMLRLYDRVIPTDPSSPRVPVLAVNAVIVNLGTNDFGRGAPDKAQVVGAFEALLAELKASYPGALTVLMLGPMLFDEENGTKQRSLMRAWLNELKHKRAAQGDAIELLEVWTSAAEGLGCDSHPSAKTHARMGRQLADLLRKRLGW